MVSNRASKKAEALQSKCMQARQVTTLSASMKDGELPWMTITLLVVILILVLTLWGRLPSRQHVLHAPAPGNMRSVFLLRARFR
jgi:hypothetical protein